jgi:hypothetical protein
MLKSEILYYPSFEPSAKLFRSFLLFFDTIKSIIPEKYDFKPSIGISKILDLVPDAFEPISPKNEDIYLDDLNLKRLKNAFEIIKEKKRENQPARLKVIIDGGSMSIQGYSFIHMDKISNKVLHLLEDSKLICPLKSLPHDEEFLIVNEDACNLIVSNVADKIANRYGWNTITDRDIDFAFNSLNALKDFQSSSVDKPVNMLISSIIGCEIPERVEYLSPKDYIEIRNRYSDIREPFYLMMDKLRVLHHLDLIGDREVLESKIRDIKSDLNSEVIKMRKSEWGMRIRRWEPIAFGGLVAIIVAISGDLATTIKVIGAILSFVAITTREIYKESDSEEDKTLKLIGKMQKDIMKKSKIKKELDMRNSNTGRLLMIER